MITLTKNGINENISTGFSWKFLLFGVLYSLYREDLKGVVLQLVIGGLTGGFAYFFIFPFTYNKRYINRLIRKGFKPNEEDDQSKEWLLDKLGYTDEP